MDINNALIAVFLFPGLLFMCAYATTLEYFDRHVYARLQNRQGPPWYQPIADFLKLMGKEVVIPGGADKTMYKVLPLLSFAAVATAFLCVPVFGPAVKAFNGDLIVVLYLLTIPTACFYLAGWYSTSIYATVGAVRALTQLFSYEVPLFMALLAPAMLAGSWSITEISAYYAANPLYVLFNLPAFVVAMLAVQGKLERVPFDLPEAETELAGGTFVEYSGRYYAMFRLTVDCEMVVLSALLSAIFVPFAFDVWWMEVLCFFASTLFIVFLLTYIRAIMPRVRIDQMVRFCWIYLTPLAMAQIIINLFLRGVVG